MLLYTRLLTLDYTFIIKLPGIEVKGGQSDLRMKQRKVNNPSASTKAGSKAKGYRVTAYGRPPTDLSLRLSAIHAMAILKASSPETKAPKSQYVPKKSNSKSS